MMRPKRFWTLRVSASTSRRLLEHVRQLDELADEVRVVADPPVELDAPDALDEDPQRPVGDADQLVDDRRRADLVEVVQARLLASSFLTVTSASTRSPATTSSTSLIDRSWPIASGVIDCGKTTVSFSGRTAKSPAASARSVGSLQIVVVQRSLMTPSPRSRCAPRGAGFGAIGTRW